MAPKLHVAATTRRQTQAGAQRRGGRGPRARFSCETPENFATELRFGAGRTLPPVRLFGACGRVGGRCGRREVHKRRHLICARFD